MARATIQLRLFEICHEKEPKTLKLHQKCKSLRLRSQEKEKRLRVTTAKVSLSRRRNYHRNMGQLTECEEKQATTDGFKEKHCQYRGVGFLDNKQQFSQDKNHLNNLFKCARQIPYRILSQHMQCFRRCAHLWAQLTLWAEN